jgi:2-polyprenyl-3-methyl-5-hydroxy-6-metoxy-1,4-benzoquinol methylase
MDFRLKALAFRALELPGGDSAHYFMQRHVTRTWPRPAKALDALTSKAQRFLREYAEHAGGTPDSVLEVGAGRDLAVPLALRRFGVSKVVSIDTSKLARLDLVRHAARHILHGEYEPNSWGDLERFGIYYHAPSEVGDRNTPVDCSCSNEVLEHVPEDQLPPLLSSLRKITRGLTVHSIDYSDHYARSDGGLSRLHFLLYTDEEWKKYNPARQYVNRLRHSDYLRLFREAGFEIIKETSITAESFPSWIEVNIADRFKRYGRDDLMAISGLIVARPA